MSNLESRKLSGPSPISTAEFDRKAEAGEDIDAHIDWDNVVGLEPGELSREQKMSLVQSQIAELLRSSDSLLAEFSLAETLSVSLPLEVSMRLAKQSAQQRVSRESLVKSWIEQKLDELEVAK